VPAAPIPLKRELAAPKEVLVPEGAAWTGQMLRQIREARGLTLPQLSERTKVTRHHLENIEADRFGSLPAPVYLRGIIMSLARELRLDGQKVSRSYLERQAAALAEAGKR
jgi:cytoskeletal protein RodZ